MQRKERPRHPHGPLKLHVHDVFVPVWSEGEDDPRQQRRAAAAGQIPDQHEYAKCGHRDCTEHHQVVHENRLHSNPDQRRGDNAFDEHGVRERQGARLGIEDVAVEEM